MVEGKKVQGIKVTKNMRKEIKFAMKRGATVDQMRQVVLGQEGKDPKRLIRN